MATARQPAAPILRKQPPANHEGSVNHVRIAAAAEECGGETAAMSGEEPDNSDRENPFRPGSDLQREADSILRSARISRNSVQLPPSDADDSGQVDSVKLDSVQVDTVQVDSVQPDTAEVVDSVDTGHQVDTVRVLAPAQATPTVLPDDDGGDEEEEEEEEDGEGDATATAAASTAASPPLPEELVVPAVAQQPQASSASVVRLPAGGGGGDGDGDAANGDGDSPNSNGVARAATPQQQQQQQPAKATTVQLKSGNKLCCSLQ